MISTDEVEDVPAKVKEITGGKLAYAVRRPVYECTAVRSHVLLRSHMLPQAACTMYLSNFCPVLNTYITRPTAVDAVFSLGVRLRKDHTQCLACWRPSHNPCAAHDLSRWVCCS